MFQCLELRYDGRLVVSIVKSSAQSLKLKPWKRLSLHRQHKESAQGHGTPTFRDKQENEGSAEETERRNGDTGQRRITQKNLEIK